MVRDEPEISTGHVDADTAPPSSTANMSSVVTGASAASPNQTTKSTPAKSYPTRVSAPLNYYRPKVN